MLTDGSEVEERQSESEVIHRQDEVVPANGDESDNSLAVHIAKQVTV